MKVCVCMDVCVKVCMDVCVYECVSVTLDSRIRPYHHGNGSYPSGLLALILLVDGVRRVCVVYDDHTPNQQPIRALFHSDGRATCYHSNGSVW